MAGARIEAAGAGDQAESGVGEWAVDEPCREADLGVDGGGGHAVVVGDAVSVSDEHVLAGHDLVETSEYAFVAAPVDVTDDDCGAAPARCGAPAPPAGVGGVGRHLKRGVAVQAEADDARVDADRRHADSHARAHQVDMVAGRQDRSDPRRLTCGGRGRGLGRSRAAAWKRCCDGRGDDQAQRGSAQQTPPQPPCPQPAREPVPDDHDADSDQLQQPRSANPHKQRQHQGQHSCQAAERDQRLAAHGVTGRRRAAAGLHAADRYSAVRGRRRRAVLGGGVTVGMVTVEGSDRGEVPPLTPTPVAVAVSTTWPASTSAWLTVCV